MNESVANRMIFGNVICGYGFESIAHLKSFRFLICDNDIDRYNDGKRKEK